jgi:hypothetical protein
MDEKGKKLEGKKNTTNLKVKKKKKPKTAQESTVF